MIRDSWVNLWKFEFYAFCVVKHGKAEYLLIGLSLKKEGQNIEKGNIWSGNYDVDIGSTGWSKECQH